MPTSHLIINSAELPGITSATPAHDGDARTIYRNGVLVGSIRYTSRRRHDRRIGPTTAYGWTAPGHRRLMTQTDAVLALLADVDAAS